MSLLQDLLFLLGLRRDSALRSYQLEEQLHISIVKLAEQEQLPEEEIHAGLLAAALAQHHSTRDLWSRWHSLSPREQEVTALICLGYTNNEIAAKLGISHTTIKTHIRNILVKYQMHGKAELRIALEDWDFREWDRDPHY
jgi:DNA-binding NarL/FixJ family response regulator